MNCLKITKNVLQTSTTLQNIVKKPVQENVEQVTSVASKTAAAAIGAYAVATLGLNTAKKQTPLSEDTEELMERTYKKYPEERQKIEKLLCSENIDTKDLNVACFFITKESEFVEFLERSSELGSEKTLKLLLASNSSGVFYYINKKDKFGEYLIPSNVIKDAISDNNIYLGLSRNGDINIYKADEKGLTTNEQLLTFSFSNRECHYTHNQNEYKLFHDHIGNKRHFVKDKERGKFFIIEETHIQEYPNGTKIKTEYKPSEVVGNYNIYETNLETNERKQIKNCFYDDNGNLNIIQDKTTQNKENVRVTYQKSKKGDTTYSIEITSADGEILLSRNRSRKVIANNHFEHSIDGKTYEIKFFDNYQCEIVDQCTKKKKILNFANILQDENIESKNMMYELLKTLSVPELILISNAKSLKGGNLRNSSYFASIGSIISANDTFILLHEIGHFRDLIPKEYLSEKDSKVMNEFVKKYIGKSININDIIQRQDLGSSFASCIDNEEKINIKYHKNPVFLEIYQQELEQFRQNNSHEKVSDIDYFTQDLDFCFGDTSLDRPKAEMFAEIHALLCTPQLTPGIAMRTQVLMDNFPRTIATVAELIQKENDELLNF